MSSRRLIEPRPGLTYEAIRAAFRWTVPSRFNIGVVCCDDQPPRSPALISVGVDGSRRVHTFGDIRAMSNRLANALREMGVTRGDRVGIVVPQSLETAVIHMAVYKLGAVALPLAALFGPDALRYRIGDAEARVVFTTAQELEKVVEAVEDRSTPIVVVGGATGHPGFEELVRQGSDVLGPVDTDAEDPAFLIYTSGTTGPPKGALHAHRALIGHLPAFELYYEFSPQPGDIHWTPADWAWIGGLMDSLIPAWYYGLCVVTTDADFDPERTIRLIDDQAITCAFLPPTALKMMRSAGVVGHRTTLRAVFTGGESLGEEMLEWGTTALGAAINEGYGQTEANLTVGNCSSVWGVRPGSMGRAIPGHDVRVLDDRGEPTIGVVGEIAVRRPDPVFMLEYWRNPDASAAKYDRDWLLTGDLGREDDDGYLWFVARADDVINSRGYRIGPGEIEDSLLGHPSVATAAVVGAPDATRGQVPVAFVVLADGVEPSDELAESLRSLVRTRLGAHEVPREVRFIDEMPRTTTGKMLRRHLRDEWLAEE